jgi:uncharacterized Zn finger protein (UPF0148 family)
MPQMEKGGEVACVVCPALAKKAMKKAKAQERLDEEKARLEREIRAKKTIERKMREERLERERLEREEMERIEREKREVEERIAREKEAERLRLVQRRREMEEERARLLALEAEEEARIARLEAEETLLLQQARNCAMAAAREEELRSMEKLAKQQEEERRLLQIQKETEARLAAERQKQKQEEDALLEEALRLEAYEAKSLASTTEAMKKDLLEQEHRRRLVDKARLDKEISELEEIRQNEEMEIRRVAEERRAEEEARMIAALEAEAASKALAAEDAIRKAKAALEHVTMTKRGIIAQTIALAEKEAIAETEEVLKAEQEDHKEAVILPSESDLHRQRWETLRLEGRAIMTRRVLQGWQLIAQHCEGNECQMSPLITKLGRTECVVCGGTGSGCDGVYASEQEDDDEMVDVDRLDPSVLPPRDILTPYYEAAEPEKNNPPSYVNQEEFEEKRDMVSKEIGKRMLLGWILLDASCPKCVMPLMMDNVGNSDVCVLCGPVEQYFDDSTIKTTEMQTLVDVVGHHDQDNVEHASVTDAVEPTLEETSFQERVAPPEHQPQPQQLTVTTHSDSLVEHDDTPGNPEPEESSAPAEDGLFKIIRERASRQSALPTPKGDPPAFTKALSKSVYEEQPPDVPDQHESFEDAQSENEQPEQEDPQPVTVEEIISVGLEVVAIPSNNRSEDDRSITITIPKNFDFADPGAVKQLMKVAAGEDLEDDEDDQTEEEEQYEDDDEDDEDDEDAELHDTIEVTNSGVIHTGKDVLSREMVSKMFLRSPYGYDFHDLGADMGLDDIKELVDIFMATNFHEPVTDQFKRGVARDILEKLQPESVVEEEPVVVMSPPPPTSAVIRLEHMPSPGDERREEYGTGGGPTPPRAFHFDDYADTQSTRSVGRRNKPTPEMMVSSRPGGRSVTAPRPPKSPAPRLPPRGGGSGRREGAPIVVGGPLSATHRYHSRSGHNAETKSISEVSRASSVASEALESIYAKIDQCKVTLMDATNTIDDQLAAADLLEKLAKAALAVRAMERQEAYE